MLRRNISIIFHDVSSFYHIVSFSILFLFLSLLSSSLPLLYNNVVILCSQSSFIQQMGVIYSSLLSLCLKLTFSMRFLQPLVRCCNLVSPNTAGPPFPIHFSPSPLTDKIMCLFIMFLFCLPDQKLSPLTIGIFDYFFHTWTQMLGWCLTNNR